MADAKLGELGLSGRTHTGADERRTVGDECAILSAERNSVASVSSEEMRPALSRKPPPSARCVPDFSVTNVTKSDGERPALSTEQHTHSTEQGSITASEYQTTGANTK